MPPMATCDSSLPLLATLQPGGLADGSADASHVPAAHHADRVAVLVAVHVDEHGGRLLTASCSLASSGTTMSVLFPVTVTVVSRVALGSAVMIPFFRLQVAVPNTRQTSY